MPPLSRRSTFALAATTLCAAQNPPQLNDNSTCIALGFPDTVIYRQRVLVPNLYNSSYTQPVFAPVYANAPLDAVNDAVTTAVLFLHGLSGDANTYFCAGMAASQPRADVVVIAPWFGSTQVSGAYWGVGGDAADISAYWTTSRWLYGGNNSPTPLQYVTSFDVLTSVMARAASAFPNLRLLTLAGFSAGAQLLSRYAFFAPLSLPGGGAAVRAIVSDASSYLYLDATRPAPACRPLYDTGPVWSCSSFEAPPEAGSCADYDTYKYGLQGLNASTSAFLQALTPQEVQADIDAFVSKDVRFIFGVDDACNCNTQGFKNDADASCYPTPGVETCSPNAYGGVGCCDTWPDSVNNVMDTGCEAIVQGSNRLQRGRVYMDYLAQLLGTAPQNAIFQGGHNQSAMFSSPTFQQWAYTL